MGFKDSNKMYYSPSPKNNSLGSYPLKREPTIVKVHFSTSKTNQKPHWFGFIILHISSQI